MLFSCRENSAFVFFHPCYTLSVNNFTKSIFFALTMALLIAGVLSFNNRDWVGKTTSLNIILENKKPTSLLFVGDIMLDRGVEYYINKNTPLYPFQKIEPFTKETDIVFGNLEGPIVKNPPQFSDESLRFAFDPKVIEGLAFANFNLLSLANNHTNNMGQNGLEQTEEILTEANIDFIGHPVDCDQILIKDEVVFLTFNKTFSFNCSDEEIIGKIERARQSNPEKFIIVAFHWGEEYQSQSSIAQQKLARQVIDAGTDLIIGSHPHVIQEREEYKGKLIFYSLGNFIFDQYFSTETQKSLAVKLELSPQKAVYKIYRLESRLSQPTLEKTESEIIETER